MNERPLRVEIVVAAGSTQADAAAIPIKASPALIVSTGNSVTGIRLPPITKGKQFYVKNLGPVGGFGGLNVYPAVGDAINALAVNAPLVMAAVTSALFLARDGTTWDTFPTVPS